MNKIKFSLIFFLFAAVAFFAGCSQEHDDLVTADAAEGGLIEVVNPAISYVVGDSRTYTGRIKVFQGNVKTTSIDVYKQFSGTLGTTQRVLLKSVDIDEAAGTGFASFDFNYQDLISGLTLSNGSALPTNDQLLSIGDTWTLTYTATTSDGNQHTNKTSTASTAVGVSTRYAGVYEVIASDYWRIGVQSSLANWAGQQRVISSIDPTTYYHTGFGPFTLADGAGAYLYFTIDANGKIDYLPEFDGTPVTGLGTYLITCTTDPNNMTNVPCGDVTNYVQKDDVNGEDILYMTYGYFSDPSGPREFYEVLKKVVE